MTYSPVSSISIMVYITSLVPVYLITGSHYGFDLHFLMTGVPVGHLDVFFEACSLEPVFCGALANWEEGLDTSWKLLERGWFSLRVHLLPQGVCSWKEGFLWLVDAGCTECWLGQHLLHPPSRVPF